MNKPEKKEELNIHDVYDVDYDFIRERCRQIIELFKDDKITYREYLQCMCHCTASAVLEFKDEQRKRVLGWVFHMVTALTELSDDEFPEGKLH